MLPNVARNSGLVNQLYSGLVDVRTCLLCRVCVLKWPAVVKRLMDRIHVNTGLMFNSLLANLYRDGHDHVSWHADDEASLGHQPTIASLSFGDTRTFQLRKNPPPVRTALRFFL